MDPHVPPIVKHFLLQVKTPSNYSDRSVWERCGDFAADPKRLQSSRNGCPAPGCPNQGPLSGSAYLNSNFGQ